MSKFIFWDLDGTVVESEEVEFKTEMFGYACNTLGLYFNLRPEEFTGHEAGSIFDLILDRNKVVNKEFYYSRYDDWYEQAIIFIKSNVSMVLSRENVVKLWKKANSENIKNVIVTSSREDVAKVYLENVGLSHLCFHYTCINHVSKPKPSPIPYLQTVKQLNLKASNCIVIEDSISGIHSAKSAGLYTIAWVKDKSINDYLVADRVLKHLDFSIIKESFECAKKLNL